MALLSTERDSELDETPRVLVEEVRWYSLSTVPDGRSGGAPSTDRDKGVTCTLMLMDTQGQGTPQY